MIHSDKRLGVRNDKILSSAQYRPAAGSVVQVKPRRFDAEAKETSSFPTGSYSSPAGAANSLSLSSVGSNQAVFTRMLDGIIPQDENRLRNYFDDIYDNDAVAGTATDIMANMPFSEYSLVGLDEAKLDVFNESISKLNIREMLPLVSVEQKVQGCYISSLIWNNKLGQFVDSLPYSLQSAQLTKMPTLGMEPTIRVVPDNILSEFLESKDAHVIKARQMLSPALTNALRSGAALLDPLTTLYVPRRVRAHATGYNPQMFSSWYRRILPIYLLEKVLYRGTHSEASRRQRGSMHVSAGIEGEWEPTPEELSALSGMFQQADYDPLGAIIVTRHGVETQEIRQGGEFWSYTNELQNTTPLKMRALGINDAFLSGEANYATLQGAIQMLLDKVKSDRDDITERVFGRKILPLIAVAKGFYDKGKLGKDLQYCGQHPVHGAYCWSFCLGATYCPLAQATGADQQSGDHGDLYGACRERCPGIHAYVGGCRWSVPGEAA